jgi:tRNA (adenine37-N6)-methyltransferase
MHYNIYPVGMVHRRDDDNWIEIFPQYRDALLGLDGFSHIYVLYWFHKNDMPEKRAILQVYPRQDPTNPLTGVFGTQAPTRPNLIGLTLCRILSIESNRIYIDAIDALDESPVIDIKCFIPGKEPLTDILLPAWV